MKDLNKLNDVARHSVSGYGRQDICYNDPEGDFVFYSDYKLLEQRAEAAERERDELRAEQAEHDEQIARMEGKFNLAKRALDSKTERCDKAESELARRDAAASEPVGYIFCHPSGKNFWAVSHPDTAGHNGVKPFYFSAPTAVLPPEWEGTEHNEYAVGKQDGWNECLAEALKLGAQSQKPVVLPHRRLATVVKGHALKTYTLSFFDPDEVIAMLESANVPYEVKK